MFAHIAKAMETDTPDGLSKWLLVVLADYANADGECWPSQSTLARRTGMNKATVNRKLKILEQAGLISRISGNHSASTRYTVQLGLSQSATRVVAECDTNLPVKPNNTLSEDWKPSEKLMQSINEIAFKGNTEIDHDIEAIKFTSHHLSKGSKFRNIDLAYRKWCANAITYAKGASSRTSNGHNNQRSRSEQHGGRWGAFISSARD